MVITLLCTSKIERKKNPKHDIHFFYFIATKYTTQQNLSLYSLEQENGYNSHSIFNLLYGFFDYIDYMDFHNTHEICVKQQHKNLFLM